MLHGGAPTVYLGIKHFQGPLTQTLGLLRKTEMYSDQRLTENANRGFGLRVAGRSPLGDAVHSELAGRPFHIVDQIL
jgi:hypothetical protein